MVGCQQVLLFDFWGVSSMSMVVWDSTGSICKVNGYLSRTGFSSLGRLWVIFCCSSAQELPRPCKFILVKGFIGASGCVKCRSVSACRLWGQFEIFIWLCERGFTFQTLPFVMEFYFALLCPNECLGSVILLFKPA